LDICIYVVMPKVKINQNTKLQLYQQEFEGETIITDNEILNSERVKKELVLKTLSSASPLNTNIHKENIKIKSTKSISL
jgi:hypothetical protein